MAKQVCTRESKEPAVKRVKDGPALAVVVVKEPGRVEQTLRNWVKGSSGQAQ